MAIQSRGEFEIIMNGVLMRVIQRVSDEPRNTTLVSAKRRLEEALEWVHQRRKPSEKELAVFADAAETLRQAWREDTGLSDKLFDLLDFLEYRL